MLGRGVVLLQRGPQDKATPRAAMDGKSLGLCCPVPREGQEASRKPSHVPPPSLSPLHAPSSLPQV